MRAVRAGRGLEVAAYLLAAASFLGGALHERLDPPPFEPVGRSDEHLRVVTWNVGEGLDQGGQGLRTEHIEHVAGVLAELDPDLCFLQEVTGRLQMRRLLRALGSGWEGVLSPVSSTRRVAALARRGSLAEFEVAEAGARALGLVYHRNGRRPVAAVGLHASAFSAEDRNHEIGGAAAQLASRYRELPHILLGDLNLDLDLDKRRDLFTDDAYRDVETYNFVAVDLIDAARDRGATAEPDRRLDYVFVDGQAFAVVDAGPWKYQRVGGMDHDPVVADLAWR